MSEVYRARDPRLGRDVAIKLLPASRLGDESRRRRFVREARAASAFSHANVVTIHEIDSAGGADFIVMEFVSGRTLQTVIRPGLRLKEALRIAIPIADALARAHAAGIVHRDLKPSNVMVSDEGVVKLLDFGLAKLLDPLDAGSATDTVTAEAVPGVSQSRPGFVAGTPGYMSPEQASGGRVDSRADIFAFGALLYELATGRRAFNGDSAAQLLAAVLRQEPIAPTRLAREVPRELERLILRCLRKDPERRFQHMADVRVELLEILEELDGLAPPQSPGPIHGRRPRWLVAALGCLLVAGASAWLLRRSLTRPAPPRLLPVTTTHGNESWPTLSPDGSQVAFSWEGENPARSGARNRDIWLKLIGSTETRRLTSDPGDETFPSWSPDGRQIAFLRTRGEESSGTIYLVSPLGGPERKLGDFKAAPSQLAWSPDSRFIVARRDRAPDAAETGGLYLIPVQAGEPRLIAVPATPGYAAHPAFSRDGRRLGYVSCNADVVPACDVYVVALGADLAARPPARRLTHHGSAIPGLAWAPRGDSLIYAVAPGHAQGFWSQSVLWRVGAGEGPVAERIESAPLGAFAPAAVATQDRLVFAQDRSDFDIYGFEETRPPRAIVASSFVDYSPSFSPDGRRIAFESSRSGDAQEIWIADADGANPVQLTRGPGSWQGNPSWSPDGRRIVFSSIGKDGAQLWTIDSDGGAPRRLTEGGAKKALGLWSRDGRWIYYREDRPAGPDIWRTPADQPGPPERITRSGGLLGSESPDGRALFYTQRDGTSPLYRQPLDGGRERRVVECVQSRALATGAGGLYYLGCAPGNVEVPLYRLDVETGRSRQLGTIDKGSGPILGMAVSPDGRTILYGRSIEAADLMLIEGFR